MVVACLLEAVRTKWHDDIRMDIGFITVTLHLIDKQKNEVKHASGLLVDDNVATVINNVTKMQNTYIGDA